jgi:hypothetical protein
MKSSGKTMTVNSTAIVYMVIFAIVRIVYGDIPYNSSSGKDFEENGVRWIRFDSGANG